MTLRLKLILALALALTLVATASVFYIKFRFTSQLHAELEKRGISIARNLAHYSATSVLARDQLSLKMLAVAQLRNEADIVYIFFLGPQGQQVLAHTFGDTFPRDLLSANPLPPHGGFSVRDFASERGIIYDIAMPVEGGGLGQVRVGISAEPVQSAAAALSGELLAVIVLFGATTLLLGLPLISSIVRPVETLTKAATGVSAGNYDHQVPVASKDEIGLLATAFNGMIVRLQTARNELLARNTDLAKEVELRRDAESQLAAQLQLISILLDEIPTPVFFKDAGGIYRGCNRAFETFTEITRDELIGSSIAALVPPDEAQVHTQADRDLFANPGSRQYEFTFTNRKGLRRDVVFQKATYNLPSGELAGMVGILIDVTHEREVDRLRNDFVSTTAHEFQTPLTAILGFCEILLTDEAISPEERRNYLEIIHERSDHLSRLVDRFLDVSRIDAGRPLPVDPHPCRPDLLLRKLLGTYSTRKSSHRIELLLPPQLPTVMVDEARFSQVIDNLLGNAVKYAPAGSSIRISAQADGDRFVLNIEDEGPGLSAEQRDKIFDKFYRADSSDHAPSGTGLGLYISRAIVAAHGGQLDVTSTPGAGCCFRIVLPLVAEAGTTST